MNNRRSLFTISFTLIACIGLVWAGAKVVNTPRSSFLTGNYVAPTTGELLRYEAEKQAAGSYVAEQVDVEPITVFDEQYESGKALAGRETSGEQLSPEEKLAIEYYAMREGFTANTGRRDPLDDNGGVTFAYAGGPLRIPPSGTGGTGSDTVFAPITVTGLGLILDVEAQFDSITHTYDGDLDIWLQSPAGTRIDLTSDNGGTGENFIRTRFDDDAANSIVSGTSPFTGDFRPEQPLSAFDGQLATGDWQIVIFDDAGGDTGVVHLWSLQILAVSGTDDHDFITIGAISPTSGPWGPGTVLPVSARFLNGGTTTESANVYYQFNGGPVESGVTNVLVQYETDTVDFAASITLPGVDGTYPLLVWCEVPGDANLNNDTATVQVQVLSGTNCNAPFVLVGGPHDSLMYNNCGAGDNTPGQSCGASGQDLVFRMDVPAGYWGSIWQSSNTIDSRHSLRWGGNCPGDSLIGCADSPDERQYTWVNNTGTTQPLYFVVGGWSLTTPCGNTVVNWELSACDPITVTYSQNFDGVTAITLPACWTQENTNALAPVWETYTTTPRSAPNCASIGGATAGNNDWLFTPALTLTGGVSYTLDYWRRATSATVAESLEVFYGAAPNSGSMTEVIAPLDSFKTTAYVQKTHDFTPVVSGNYHVGFHNLSRRSTSRTRIDDVLIYETGTCAAPIVTVNDASGVGSATLTAATTGGFGGAPMYQWYTGGACVAGNEIAGEASSTYIAIVSGTYSCRVYYSDSLTCADCDDAVASILPPGSFEACSTAVEIAAPPPNGVSIVTGTTTGAIANCSDSCNSTIARSSGPDHFYYLILDSCRRLTFALDDGTVGSGDMYITVYEGGLDGCCSHPILCNDDISASPAIPWEGVGQRGTGVNSYVGGELTAGTYYIRVARYTTSSGPYRLRIFDNGPCPCSVSCAGGDSIEPAENRWDSGFRYTDPNGGCNNTVPTYGTINCGETLCGVLFNYLAPNAPTTIKTYLTDTDWYTLTLASDAIVSLNVLDVQCGILLALVDASNCAAPIILLADSADACNTLALSDTIPAGSYTGTIRLRSTYGNPMPVHYRVSVDCAGLCQPDSVEDLTVRLVNDDGDPAANDIRLGWFAPPGVQGTYKVYVDGTGGDFPGSWSELATGIAPVAFPGPTFYVDDDAAALPMSRRFYLVVGVCP